MKIIVAVSGGVDSVVLLHKLVKSAKAELVVAHFDHGIRPNSDGDARFVEALADLYKLPFEGCREELGIDASEAYARERRYRFLRDVAVRHEAKIVTAHHADDVIETIAINLQRGTGWRGLAVLDSLGIFRPLTAVTKQDIYRYALKHNLEWVEDETNATDAYLRNRIRSRLHQSFHKIDHDAIHDLWRRQKREKQLIDSEVVQLLTADNKYSRYFFTHVDYTVAIELLRSVLQAKATRPQLERGLHAIKTARVGSTVDIGSGVKLRFAQTDFVAEIPQ